MPKSGCPVPSRRTRETAMPAATGIANRNGTALAPASARFGLLSAPPPPCRDEHNRGRVLESPPPGARGPDPSDAEGADRVLRPGPRLAWVRDAGPRVLRGAAIRVRPGPDAGEGHGRPPPQRAGGAEPAPRPRPRAGRRRGTPAVGV